MRIKQALKQIIDKRKAQRIWMTGRVWYKSARKKSAWRCISRARLNISGRGIQLSAKEPLTINDRINIILHLKGFSKPVTALCKVIWQKKDGSDGYRAGVEFLKIKKEESFILSLCEQMLDLSLELEKLKAAKRRLSRKGSRK